MDTPKLSPSVSGDATTALSQRLREVAHLYGADPNVPRAWRDENSPLVAWDELDAIAAIAEEAAAVLDGLTVPQWQPIETAPKGSGLGWLVADPGYAAPPNVLLLFDNGAVSVGYWDWYYAKGGSGYEGDGHSAWVEPVSGEQVSRHYDQPTHWQHLPPPPPVGQEPKEPTT